MLQNFISMVQWFNPINQRNVIMTDYDRELTELAKEGTKNYYYFDVDSEAMEQLLHMLTHAKEIMQNLPARKENK